MEDPIGERRLKTWTSVHATKIRPDGVENRLGIVEALCKLISIDNFDARDLKRCSVPGCGAHLGGRKALTHLW